MTNDPRALSNLSVADYEAIELAVMETARGRWFLKAYAERNRHADTKVLLDAIARLEGAVTGERAMAEVDRVRFDLTEMARAISQLKAEIGSDGSVDGPPLSAATHTLDDIVKTTEEATSRILGAAEAMQEMAWKLRESVAESRPEAGASAAACDTLDKLATDIYGACSVQDLTAQRTAKVIRTLRFLEGRINAVIDSWSDQRDRDGNGSVVDHAPFVSQRASFADAVNPAPEMVTPRAVTDIDLDDDLVDLAPLVVRLPDTGLDDVAFEMATEPMPDEAHVDQMPTIIDDTDPLDIDIVLIDADVVEDLTEKGPFSPSPPRQRSLADLDALSTTEKALIFG